MTKLSVDSKFYDDSKKAHFIIIDDLEEDEIIVENIITGKRCKYSMNQIIRLTSLYQF